MPEIGAYWIRAPWLSSGWTLAEVSIWGGRDLCAHIVGAEGPFWPNELKDVEWRAIERPSD